MTSHVDVRKLNRSQIHSQMLTRDNEVNEDLSVNHFDMIVRGDVNFEYSLFYVEI